MPPAGPSEVEQGPDEEVLDLGGGQAGSGADPGLWLELDRRPGTPPGRCQGRAAGRLRRRVEEDGQELQEEEPRPAGRGKALQGPLGQAPRERGHGIRRALLQLQQEGGAPGPAQGTRGASVEALWRAPERVVGLDPWHAVPLRPVQKPHLLTGDGLIPPFSLRLLLGRRALLTQARARQPIFPPAVTVPDEAGLQGANENVEKVPLRGEGRPYAQRCARGVGPGDRQEQRERLHHVRETLGGLPAHRPGPQSAGSGPVAGHCTGQLFGCHSAEHLPQRAPLHRAPRNGQQLPQGAVETGPVRQQGLLQHGQPLLHLPTRLDGGRKRSPGAG